MVVAVVVAVACGAALWWLRRTWVAVSVDGDSMEPTYRHGDRVLVRRCGPAGLALGAIVVVEQPAAGGDVPAHLVRLNIKRLAALPGDPVPASVRPVVDVEVVPAGALVVLGDNPRGCDSRSLGFYRSDRVMGVVVRRVSAASRG
ncbi:hypothetical protein FKR81_19030 [Lentzea tibetensis]|uniref:Peptidase S26 domain-containing protein n=1 Tax=Lentzea tibetensis TaxID=2591470 RepID=A0A563EU98_9PSEU|nr:S26 family signal peptidase [Lentzea tibetensis]TWP50704.1 hypothetical protein FKR81_19030 [Lentzea tibetensis]